MGNLVKVIKSDVTGKYDFSYYDDGAIEIFNTHSGMVAVFSFLDEDDDSDDEVCPIQFNELDSSDRKNLANALLKLARFNSTKNDVFTGKINGDDLLKELSCDLEIL